MTPEELMNLDMRLTKAKAIQLEIFSLSELKEAILQNKVTDIDFDLAEGRILIDCSIEEYRDKIELPGFTSDVKNQFVAWINLRVNQLKNEFKEL